tara:strand:+ start:296 stop:472 length:177 start_codon:yes stop_codon:yes gene_type:complete
MKDDEIKDKNEFYHLNDIQSDNKKINSIINKNEYKDELICGKLLKLNIKDDKYWIEII